MKEAGSHMGRPHGDLIASIPFVGSVIVLVVNDGYLKWAHTSWVTGKLSDVAGLFFTPILVLAVLEFVWELPHKLARAVVYSGIALFFGWSQVSASGESAYLGLFSLSRFLPRWGSTVSLTQDTTDLLALVGLVLSFWWSGSAIRRLAETNGGRPSSK